MAETLGSLCDKLAIVKLKQLHAKDATMRKSLAGQAKHLQEEISEYVAAAARGDIPPERLSFSANKIYKRKGNAIPKVSGNIGEIFSRLMEITAQLWRVQEKIYDFENVPMKEKNSVVKAQRVLNLERNRCMDELNNALKRLLKIEKI